MLNKMELTRPLLSHGTGSLDAGNEGRAARDLLGLLESLGNELEVVDNVDVLGALGLALAALKAFAGFPVVLGYQVIIELAVTLLVGKLLQGVVQAKVLGYGNLLGTPLRTVVAGRTLDGNGVADDFGRLGEDGLLLVVKGLEILHIAGIILHLFHVAHATEHRQHTRQ